MKKNILKTATFSFAACVSLVFSTQIFAPISLAQKTTTIFAEEVENDTNQCEHATSSMYTNDYWFDDNHNLHFLAYCLDCSHFNEETMQLEYNYTEDFVVPSGNYYVYAHFDSTCKNAEYYYVTPLMKDPDYDYSMTMYNTNPEDYVYPLYFENGDLLKNFSTDINVGEPDATHHVSVYPDSASIDANGTLAVELTCHDCGSSLGTKKYLKNEYELSGSSTASFQYALYDGSVKNLDIFVPYTKTQTIKAPKTSFNFNYNNTKAQTLALNITGNKEELKYTCSNAKYVSVKDDKIHVAKGAPCGTYTIKAYAIKNSMYKQSNTLTFTVTVNKLGNTLTVTPLSKNYSYAAVKKAAIRFKLSVAQAKGKVTYVSSSRNVTISSTGRVTIKKGTRKGTYKITVKAAGTSVYKAGSKTVKIAIK